MAVTPSATAIGRLGRLVAADVPPKLTETELTEALILYALADSETVVPGESGWLETYDMNGAAVECFRWKLAKASSDVSFTADGSRFELKELTANLENLIKHYNGIRVTGTVSIRP